MVCGIVLNLTNFGHRTTNCVEQFFGKVKLLVDKRVDMVSFVRELLKVVDNMDSERRAKLVYRSVTVPTSRPHFPIGFSTQYEDIFYK